MRSLIEELYGGYPDRLPLSVRLTNRVPERLSDGGEIDLRNIAILQAHTLAKTEDVSTKKVDMYISGPAVRLIFEMVMFQVGQRVTHVRLSGMNLCLPDLHTLAGKRHLAGNVAE